MGPLRNGRRRDAGQGRIVEREYTQEELDALGDAISTLGAKTLDVYLNDRAFWRNVPAAIWDYKLGGYQVLKKWLSYRERDVLGWALTPEEVRTSRRWRGGLGLYRICVERIDIRSFFKFDWDDRFASKFVANHNMALSNISKTRQDRK